MQSVQYVSDGLVYGYEQWSWISRSLDSSKFGMLGESRGADRTMGALLRTHFWEYLENKWIYETLSGKKQ